MKDDDPDVQALRHRDRRFVLRVVLLVAIGALGALYVGTYLTGDHVGGCAARGFGDVTESS